jgi:hypothetical protein
MPPAARKPPQSDSIDRIMNDPALPPPDEDDFRKRDLSRRSGGPALAPWLIVVFGQRRGGIEREDNVQNYYITESVGIATGFLLAALHAANIATLTHTPNPMRFLNHVCQRPSTEKPIMIVVAGHAAADATVPLHALRKKPLAQISSWL